MRAAVLAATVIALMVATEASATQPLNRIVWGKVTAAYTLQAKAHGAVAVCSPFNTIVGMDCTFGTKGKISVTGSAAEPCSLAVLVQKPKVGMPSTYLSSTHAELTICGARWWQKPMPAPWATPAA